MKKFDLDLSKILLREIGTDNLVALGMKRGLVHHYGCKGIPVVWLFAFKTKFPDLNFWQKFPEAVNQAMSNFDCFD